MYLLKPGIKQNPVKHWALPDRVFFASGACHILAHAFLQRYPDRGFYPVWIRPTPGFTGNHVFVTDGELAFDYHGYSLHLRLVDHFRRRACRYFPRWGADLVAVTVSLVSHEETERIGMHVREPHQFLHNALPRAQRFLEGFDHEQAQVRGTDSPNGKHEPGRPRTSY